MIEKLKLEISNLLKNYYKSTYNVNINVIVEETKDSRLGDLAIPIFIISKVLKKSLELCSKEVKGVIEKSELSETILNLSMVNGFFNIFLKRDYLVKNVINNNENIKNNIINLGKDKTIVIDYSSPNIAKPFSVGHLRSTIIGNALANIHEKLGYKVIRINHLGDWGTQFGKLIVAYKKWGNEADLKINPIQYLLDLYVKFHILADDDSSLEDEARSAFLKLENGEEEYLMLWKWFKDESLKEFMNMYDLLGVKFDSFNGEAFYNDKMDNVITELETKKLLIEDDGANIVKLNDMPPALIKKRDGSSLYITRDLAAVFYRKNKYNFNKVLYVIGNEQSLHINQLKAVIKAMNYDWFDELIHINFGLVMQNGKKMSTRKGKIVKLYDVIEEAIKMAYSHLDEKNPNLINKDEVAQAIGVSAIIFNDLKNIRTNDIEFNLEEMIKAEGLTGPYLQYTTVRILSLLTSSEFNKSDINYNLVVEDHYFEIIKLLDKFNNVLIRSAKEYDPSIIAKYALNLSQSFNRFYGIEKILVDDILERNTKLTLTLLIYQNLTECMKLLGMKIIEKM